MNDLNNIDLEKIKDLIPQEEYEMFLNEMKSLEKENQKEEKSIIDNIKDFFK